MNVAQTEDIIQKSQYKSIHLLYDHIDKHYEYFNRGSADQQTYGASNSTPERGEGEQETGKEKHIAEEKNMDNGEGQIQGEPSKTRGKGEKEQEIHKLGGKSNKGAEKQKE
eukprot:6186903-Pleurochrysis_carterae.AAC.2